MRVSVETYETIRSTVLQWPADMRFALQDQTLIPDPDSSSGPCFSARKRRDARRLFFLLGMHSICTMRHGLHLG